eukprot:4818816-Heterocapsa_arctica.AAC.1
MGDKRGRDPADDDAAEEEEFEARVTDKDVCYVTEGPPWIDARTGEELPPELTEIGMDAEMA